MFSLFTSCWLESNEAVDLIRLNLIQISNRAKRDYYQLDSLLLCREITFEFVWRRYLYPGGKVLPFAGNFCLLCTIYHLTTTHFERVEISQKYQINYLIAAIKLFKFWSREWHSSQKVKKIRTGKVVDVNFLLLKTFFFVVINRSRDAEEGKVFGKNNRISAIEAGFGERKVTFTAFND